MSRSLCISSVQAVHREGLLITPQPRSSGFLEILPHVVCGLVWRWEEGIAVNELRQTLTSSGLLLAGQASQNLFLNYCTFFGTHSRAPCVLSSRRFVLRLVRGLGVRTCSGLVAKLTLIAYFESSRQLGMLY